LSELYNFCIIHVELGSTSHKLYAMVL